jgi:hypothetical protein
MKLSLECLRRVKNLNKKKKFKPRLYIKKSNEGLRDQERNQGSEVWKLLRTDQFKKKNSIENKICLKLPEANPSLNL